MADEFETLIVVDEKRMNMARMMDLQPHKFSTNPEDGFIHCKNIKDLRNLDIEEENKIEPTIFIVLTGWNDKYNRNLPHYFKVPYSSHSNYRELEKLVRACTPKNLVYNVDDRAITKKRLEFQQYLIKEYCRRDTKPNMREILNDPLRGYVSR